MSIMTNKQDCNRYGQKIDIIFINMALYDACKRKEVAMIKINNLNLKKFGPEIEKSNGFPASGRAAGKNKTGGRYRKTDFFGCDLSVEGF